MRVDQRDSNAHATTTELVIYGDVSCRYEPCLRIRAQCIGRRQLRRPIW